MLWLHKCYFAKWERKTSRFIFAIPHLEKSFINPKLTIFSLKSEVILLPSRALNCSVMSYRRNCSCSSCPLNALLTSALKTNSSLIVEMTDPLQTSILLVKYSARGRWELSHCSHIYLPVFSAANFHTLHETGPAVWSQLIPLSVPLSWERAENHSRINYFTVMVQNLQVRVASARRRKGRH